MIETKHTPGPWIFYADLPSTDPDWHIVTTANRMRVLANVHIEPGNAMDIANARLIAAAPDLLEALRKMMALDPPLTGNPSHSVLVKFWQSEKEQGRGSADTHLFALATIAAATGATP